MADYQAWLLSAAGGWGVAVGQYELKHLAYEVPAYFLPTCPAYCCELIEWRQHWLPLLDLDALLTPDVAAAMAVDAVATVPLVAVVAFVCPATANVKLGAIRLTEIPRRVAVSAGQQTELPDNWPHWSRVASTAFHCQQQVWPVLDLGGLFQSSEAHLFAP